jgi:hypothetical protein
MTAQICVEIAQIYDMSTQICDMSTKISGKSTQIHAEIAQKSLNIDKLTLQKYEKYSLYLLRGMLENKIKVVFHQMVNQKSIFDSSKNVKK